VAGSPGAAAYASPVLGTRLSDRCARMQFNVNRQQQSVDCHVSFDHQSFLPIPLIDQRSENCNCDLLSSTYQNDLTGM
jgi:hypothetical protein